jgi:N-glycosylase/DNA lyase
MDDCIRTIISLLPNPDKEVMTGVKWGRCDEIFTPAYWKLQYHLHEEFFSNDFYRISHDLVEEICACILGGFGMKAELGMLAFERLRDLYLLEPGVSAEELETALAIPFLSNDKRVKYRFPKQKAKYLNHFLNRPDLDQIPVDNDLLMRKWLTSIKGIGMKTASWITRNWLDSQHVAILDVHIYRAGLIAGFFEFGSSLINDYEELEKRYLTFSNELKVNAANLDSLMWLQLKEVNDVAIDILKNKKVLYVGK